MRRITIFTVFAFSFALCSNIAMAQKVSASFGKGINFMAADTSFSLQFRYRQQQLLETTFIENANGNFNNATNFQVRRSRLKFAGHAFDPRLTFKAEIGLTSRDISSNREDGNTGGSPRVILDAVLKYKFSKSWAIWVGQTKLPGNRERVISSANLQFVDRSLLNSRFNIDRDAGFQLRGTHQINGMIFKPSIALSKGEGRGISTNNIGGFNYTAHLDYLPFGEFEAKKGDYISSDLERNKTPKLSIGLTYDLNDGASRAGGQLGNFITTIDQSDSTNEVYASNDLQSLMADAMFKYKGISWATEFAIRKGNNKEVNSNYNLGNAFVTQVGYLFKSNWEIAGRFTTVRKADLSALTSVNEYTLGVSKYIVGHSLKLQSDLSRTNSPNSALASYRFRMQMEMQF